MRGLERFLVGLGCWALLLCSAPRVGQAADYLAQIHEGLSVGGLAGTLDLLGEPLELVEQRPGSLSAGLDGALPVSEPLQSASFRLGEVNSLLISPYAEPLSPGLNGLPGQSSATFGGRMTLAGPRDLPAIPLPDNVGTFPASTLESASFDVALRDVSLQLSSPDSIPVTAGAFDAQQTVGSLAGFADVNGQLTLGFDTLGRYITAATMLNVLKGIYPDIVTSIHGDLVRRELAVDVQSRLDLSGQALANDATAPGSYQLVGAGPAIHLPWLTSVDETLLDGVASVSLRVSGLAVAPAPGDATGDGKIDLSDFGVLKSNFGRSANLAGGDLDGSGQVTLDDFGILKSQFGAAAASAAVPEPPSFALFLAAAFTFAASRSRRGR